MFREQTSRFDATLDHGLPSLARSASLLSLLLVGLAALPAWADDPVDPATAADSATPDEQAVDLERITAFVDDFFEREMAALDVPGAAFAFVRHGEVELLRGYGMADLEAGVPVDPETTVFRVGSVSKPVTALAVLQLEARGRLDLRADLDAVLGDDLIPDSFVEPVTPFHLLTHTAGFGERLFGQHATTPEDVVPLRTYLERRLPPRRRPPGRVIGYNDHHTALAGLLVAEIAGRPFAEAARELVLDPLGMDSSSFEQVDLPADMASHLAVAYRVADGPPAPLPRDYVITTPGAGLFTTARDMGHFLGALTAGRRAAGPIGVAPEAVHAMLRPQFRHHEAMPGRAFGLAEGHRHGHRTLYKDGQCSGFTARIFLLPDVGVAWFSVQSRSIFGTAGAIGPVNRLHRRLAEALVEEFWPEGSGGEPTDLGAPDLPPEPRPVEGQSTQRYAGIYRDVADPAEGWEGALLVNELRVEARDDGTLRVFGAEPWVESEPGVFRHGEVDPSLLRFVENEAGEPAWVTFGGGSWERVPWYRTAGFQRTAGAGLLLVLVTSGPVLLYRRLRGRPLPSGAGATAAATGFLVLFVAGLGIAMLTTDVQRLYSGVTPLLRLVFLLPVAALLAAVLGAVKLTMPLVTRGGSEGSSGPVAPSATVYWLGTALACGALLVLLRSMHLLGWPA